MLKDGIGTQEQLDHRPDGSRGRQVEARRARQADRGAERRRPARRADRRTGHDPAQPGAVATRQQQAAAVAQRAKADVRLAYTEMHAPIDGIVDVRAARTGEFVTAGQPVITLVNPDDLWVRADVEETYIDRVSWATRCASACRRARSARGRSSTAASTPAFATQRDVSRTKRDIKTFEIRLASTTRIAGWPSA